jgi:hypothetical protein
MKKIIVAILFLPIFLIAQELEADVSVNFGKLTISDKERLTNFEQDIQNYLNSTSFTGTNWDYDKIKCTFNIFFTGSSDQTHYTAQVNVTSIRQVEKSDNPTIMLNVMDNNWEFIYQAGQSMYFNADYDPLTDFLDFYAFVIVGLNEDSYSELGGSSYFTKAFNQAIFDASYSNAQGWQITTSSYNRRGLVEDLVNEKYRTFREDFYDYHYNGLDLFTTRKDAAINNIVKLVKDLDVLKTKIGITGVLIKIFFDAKSGEIVNYLRDYPDKSIFKTLKKIDPPHTAKYDEVLFN